jgi:hypothetical protein
MKWAVLGTFNVMQFFFFNGSQSFKNKDSKESGVKYMEYLRNVFDNALFKMIDSDRDVK